MRLAHFIRSDLEAILSEWEGFAATIPNATGMKRAALRDHAQGMLLVIARDLETFQSEEEQEEKSKGEAPVHAIGDDTAAETHASGRFADGFDLDQMVSEYRALRASVIKLWAPAGTDPHALRDLTRFNEAIDQALTESIGRYSEHLNRSRELFMGVLGHDLRTPIGSILMSAQFLTQTLNLERGEHSKSISRILNSANRIKAMVSDLLDVALTRLGGALPVTFVPMDLADSCREAIEESQAFHPNATLKVALSGDLQGTWDKGRIAQLLSNLVENAVHYGSSDRAVTVSADGTDGGVVLKVHNHGPAIPPAMHSRIFEPLVTSNDNTTQHGMGLGLYITSVIATALGGSIGVDSSEQGGTTFTVNLPRHSGPQRSSDLASARSSGLAQESDTTTDNQG